MLSINQTFVQFTKIREHTNVACLFGFNKDGAAQTLPSDRFSMPTFSRRLISVFVVASQALGIGNARPLCGLAVRGE